MATGLGKTGIIAYTTVFSQYINQEDKLVLVVSPRKAIRNQLYRNMKDHSFLRKIIPDSKVFDKVFMPVVNIESGSILNLNKRKEKQVLCMTIQLLSTLKRDNPKMFEKLMANVSTVFFDEGHYEPSLTWSDAVRSLDVPVILLSATPYRNDQKRFQIHEEDIVAYGYHYGTNSNKSSRKKYYLRSAHFEILNDSKQEKFEFSDYKKFAESLIFWTNKQIENKKFPKSVKVNIRCKNAENIRKVTEALNTCEKKDVAIGVHDTFNSNRLNLIRHVPKDLPERKERFWVHQYKFLEGVDDPAIQVIVFYDDGLNDRAIIQQIGRALRNTSDKNKKPQTAYVLIKPESNIESNWNQFKSLDKKIENNPENLLPEALTKAHRKFIELCNENVKYFDGKISVAVVLTSKLLSSA